MLSRHRCARPGMIEVQRVQEWGCVVGAVSSRIGLVRLVMGAAFMILAFFLASTTQARADDAGLLGVTSASVTTVVSSTAAVVDSVVAESNTVAEEPVRTVESVVTQPAKAVTAVVAEPVADVATTTSAVISSTASAVKPATDAVVRAVEPIVAPVTDAVVTPVLPVLEPVTSVLEPVASVLDPAVGVVEPAVAVIPSTPVTDTSGAAGAAIDVERVPTDTPTGNAVVVALPASPAAVDRLGGAAASASSLVALPTLRVERAASVVQPSGAHRPSDTPTPAPAQLSPAVVPGSGTAGSSGSASDAATTPSTLTLPTSSSAALTSHTSLPCPGPALDPGSRPD